MIRETAMVVVHFGRQLIAERDDNSLVSCLIKGRKLKPVCGDRVEIQNINQSEDEWVVESITKEHNHFVRVDPKLKPHKIAANLDRIFIVCAVEPAPSKDLINSYLIACHALNIEAAIILNKTDLGPLPTELAQQLQLLEALNYPVFKISCKQHQGLDSLRSFMHQKTQIFVGQSGVGKSSLINYLLPDEDIMTGVLAKLTGKGAHTTTHTRRYTLPEGGWLIDSPGVWEFGIWEMPKGEIAYGFIEFQTFLGQCKFNNCSHIHEPGCAIKQAVESGLIAEPRWQSYQRIIQTLNKRR